MKYKGTIHVGTNNTRLNELKIVCKYYTILFYLNYLTNARDRTSILF